MRTLLILIQVGTKSNAATSLTRFLACEAKQTGRSHGPEILRATKIEASSI